MYWELQNDIKSELSKLVELFNDFDAKYKMIICNLLVSRRCSEFLIERNVQIEHDGLNNAQNNQTRNLKINKLPADVANKILGHISYRNICRT